MNQKIRKIPNEDHVMRYVPWTKLIKDDSENIVGIFAQAFERKQNLKTGEVEEALSVNWLEFHGGDRESNTENSVRAMRASLSIGRKSAFAIGNVDEIKKICRARNVTIRVLHEPEQDNPAHATIRQLPKDDLDLLDALATDVFRTIVLNKDISDA